MRYLLNALGLNVPGVLPLYLGDDITDEDAFRALRGVGIGILVGRSDDPETGERPTAAAWTLASPEEVRHFLDALAR